MYWLPLVLFIAHMVEEYPQFPAWATRHFGTTSKAWYVYSHVPLVVIVLWICHLAQSALPQTGGALLGTALACTLALNAVFHIVTTFLFREYSPGVITGIVLLLPGTGYLLWKTIDQVLVTPSQFTAAIALGAAAQIAMIGSLYLHMNIDWQFHRQSQS